MTDSARRAHAIFTAALDTPRERRDAAVAEACAGDPALESHVRRLLAASDQTAGFLDSPALAALGGAAAIPDAVGNYLVIGVLGMGGMATVYEAVQDNPSRRVALKVMHHGMTHTDAYLRFRLEAESLARLRHPGIAQIYEAGTANLGPRTSAPFFAMELIQGACPITEYAARRSLSLRERLAMFASVCDAVLHGHQNGIIHRDLKPANVLVGADGRPKVIDFGIARTTELSPDGASSLTAGSESSKILGTLSYMSPEQCLAPQTVDVRTDVYSLGVMLFQLVAGKPPYSLAGCSIPAAVHVITDGVPPRASTLNKQADRDLDAIIAKAMSKDRSLRYGGAGALAADIRRWLDVLPIEARPPTTAENVRMFVRRNPPLAAAIAALALTLVVGSAVAGRLAYAATRARDAALQRERELETVTEFQESLLRGIDVAAMGDRLRASVIENLRRAAAAQQHARPGLAAQTDQAIAPTANPHAGADDAAPSDPLADARRLIDGLNFTSLALQSLNESILQRCVTSINTQFADQPALQARLLQQLASTMNTLGLYAEAEPLIRRALQIRRELLGDDHPDTLQSRHALGSLLSTFGRYDESIPLLRDAYERRVRIFGPDHPTTLRSSASLGRAYRSKGDLPEAERVWSETLRAQRRVLGDDDPETLRTLNNMGVVYAAQGKVNEAEACWRELLDRRRRLNGEDSPEYLGSLGNLGVLLQDQRRFDEARPLVEQALAADRRRYGDAHTSTLVSMSQLASLLEESGDLARAEALYTECLAARTAVLGPQHPDTLNTAAALASFIYRRGDHAQALQMITSALEGLRRILGEDHPAVASVRQRLAKMSEPASPAAELKEPARQDPAGP